MRLNYLPSNKEERIDVLNFLISNGYRWHQEASWSGNSIEDVWNYEDYSVITISPSTKSIAGNYRSIPNVFVNLIEFFKAAGLEVKTPCNNNNILPFI